MRIRSESKGYFVPVNILDLNLVRFSVYVCSQITFDLGFPYFFLISYKIIV